MLPQILPVGLFTCILGLNITNKLIICSFLFVLSVLITNLIAKYHTANTIGIVALCVLGNVALNWYNINILFLGSYLAIITSLFCSTYIFNILHRKFALSFLVSNFISATIAAPIDSAIVSTALLNRFSVNKVLEILLKDWLFKLAYASLITFCIYVMLYLIQTLRKINTINKFS
ncbi:hypothetical protein OCHUTO_0292 [Orientia chuto str. Dubai]|uniref:Uncharacterized protein n=1 Tax=Orientia chuto str. Dubai TaxID=1359168 RepID=A0A0F3MN48_9RICK|nr:VUT family protein [Candidatus Orientia mediorientalis]KJV56897.1 hypothetical protein OCHUTO_0292 [Orientia chuto str. Dubai]